MASEFILTSTDDIKVIGSALVDHFDSESSPVKVIIKPCSNRSLNQNSTYWMWLGELSHQIKLKTRESYSTDDLHEWFKNKFCPDKAITLGKQSLNVKSTRKLDTGEMHFYMNQLFEWSVNAGFKLTVPIESEYRQIMERQNA